jgi:hypothetical protein
MIYRPRRIFNFEKDEIIIMQSELEMVKEEEVMSEILTVQPFTFWKING